MNARICEGYASCACECSRVPPKDLGDICPLKMFGIFGRMLDGEIYTLRSDGLYKLTVADEEMQNEDKVISFDDSDASKRCGIVQ